MKRTSTFYSNAVNCGMNRGFCSISLVLSWGLKGTHDGLYIYYSFDKNDNRVKSRGLLLGRLLLTGTKSFAIIIVGRHYKLLQHDIMPTTSMTIHKRTRDTRLRGTCKSVLPAMAPCVIHHVARCHFIRCLHAGERKNGKRYADPIFFCRSVSRRTFLFYLNRLSCLNCSVST